MALGIDVGAAAIVTALDEDTVVRQRSAILSVEHSELAEQFLEPDDTLSAQIGDRMYAIGDAADEFSGIVDESPDRFVRDGQPTAPREDTPDLVEAILTFRDDTADGPLGYVSYPGASAVDKAIEDAAETLAYDPWPVGPGVGTAYAIDEPTTLAVVIGATTTSATLVVEGVPIARATIDRATDWIESQYAEATGRDPKTVAIERAETTLDDSGALALQYDALFRTLVEEISGPDWIAPGGPVPVVVAGAAPDGVEHRVAETLDDVSLPFEIGEVRRVSDPVIAPARGARITARASPGDRHAEAAPIPYAPSWTDDEAFQGALASATGPTPGDANVGADGAGSGAIGDDPASSPGMSATGGSGTSTADGSESHVAGASTAGVHDETLRTDLEALADDVETLTNQFATLRTDVDTLTETLPEADLEETIDLLEDSIGDIESELAELREGTAPADRDVEELEADVADSDGLETLRGELDEIDENLASVEDTLSDLDGRVESLDGQVGEFDDELAALDSLREELASLRSTDGEVEFEAIADVRDELDGLQSTVDEIESTIDALHDASVPETDEEALASVRSRTEELESRLDSLWDRFETRIEELEDRIVGVQDDIVDASERIDGLEDGLANVDDRLEPIDTVSDRVETVYDRLEAIDQQVNAVDDRVDHVDDRLGERIESVSETAVDAEVRTADLGERVESIATTVADLRSDVESIDVDSDGESPDMVDSRLDEIEAIASRAAEDVDTLAARVDEELDAGGRDANGAEFESLRERLDAVESTLDTLDEAHGPEAFDELRTRVDELGALRERVDQLEETESDGPDDESIEGLRDEIDGLRDRVESVSSETTSPGSGGSPDRGRLRDLRADLDATEDELESIRTELTAITDLERRLDRIDDLQEDVAALQEVRTELTDATGAVEELRDRSAERHALLAQNAGLVLLGVIAAGLTVQTDQTILAPAFVAVPLLVSLLVWRML